MAILLDRETKLITVGFTGEHASFHSLQCRDYGTRFMGGVVPGKGGKVHEGFPIFNTVSSAVAKTGANAAMIAVPPVQAADAILECIDVDVDLIVAITEGIPVHEMVKVKRALQSSRSRLIGPNSPGVITPGEAKIGIMPGHIHMPGPIGVMSRSGTLLYEAVFQLTARDLGQSTCVGVGSDLLIGTNLIDLLKLYNLDEETHMVLCLGEIGGIIELEMAYWIKENMTKPVAVYIAGDVAPPNRVLGHAGAIIKHELESASKKREILESCGVYVIKSPAQIGESVEKLMKKLNE